MSNWTKDELDIERVRGLFVLGVIASILVYWEYHIDVSDAIAKSVYGALIVITLNIVSIVLLVFWGGYVLLMAMSMRPGDGPTRLDPIFEALKQTGFLFFGLGSFVTALYTAVLFAFLVTYTLLTFPDWAQGIVLGTVTSALIGNAIWALSRWKGRTTARPGQNGVFKKLTRSLSRLERDNRALGLAGVVLAVLGFIFMLLNYFEVGVGIVALGISVIGAGLAFEAKDLLVEIRRGEVDKKIAMIRGYNQDRGGKILADLDSLERFAGSSTDAQVAEIVKEGKILVTWMTTQLPNDVVAAQETLDRILKPHGKDLSGP